MDGSEHLVKGEQWQRAVSEVIEAPNDMIPAKGIRVIW